MDRLPPILVNQGIGGLLNAIVLETINRIDAKGVGADGARPIRDADQFVVGVHRRDQVLLKRRHQMRGGAVGRLFVDDRQRSQIEGIADACGELQRPLRLGAEPAQLPDNEIDHVGGDSALPHCIEAPPPAAKIGSESDRPRLRQRL